jgi:hypothetical protein
MTPTAVASPSLSSAPLRTAIVLGTLVAGLVTRPEAQSVPLSLERLTLKSVVADRASYQNRDAIRLLESDSSRNTLGIAIINGITFKDGAIDVNVAGRRGPTAAPDDRGFIGLAFRVSPNAERFEYIYLRPDNGRVDDQIRRNHATQYGSHPDFTFQRMRKEFPEKYESYVDLEYGAWTHMRIEVAGTTAKLFVHGAAQPALVVTDLKLGLAQGGIALWIGPGTEGFFSHLRVSAR